MTDDSRVVLVTGTSSGIGLATAVAAARAGWQVIATLRDPSRATELTDAAAAAGVGLDVHPLDVVDPASVGAAIDHVTIRYGRLDALVNNAGSTKLGTAETLSLDDVRAVMEVNYIGVVALTQAALPHLRAAGGRLVTVTSVGGVVGQPFNDAYCASKFAVEGFMQSLAPVAATVGVRVSVVEPGAVASRFVANAGIDTDRILTEAGPYQPALQAYLGRTIARFDPDAAQSPDDVARVIVEVLDDPAPPFRVQTSDGARAFAGVSLGDLDGSAVSALTAGWVVAP